MHHNGNKLLTDVTIILFSLCFPLSFVSVIFIYSFLLHISFIYWNCIIIRIIGRFARVHMFFLSLSRSLIFLIRNIPPKHTHSHKHTHKSIEKKKHKKKCFLTTAYSRKWAAHPRALRTIWPRIKQLCSIYLKMAEEQINIGL